MGDKKRIMDKVKLIIKNSGWVLSARGIDILSGLIIVAIVARYLGVEEFGIYSFLMAIVWSIMPVLTMGIPRILAREIAQNKDKAANFVGIGITFTGLVIIPIILTLLALCFTFRSREVFVILVSAFGISFMALAMTIRSTFIAFERMEIETISSFVCALSFLIFIACVVYFDLGFIYIFVAMAGANLLGLLLSLRLTSKYFHFAPAPNIDIVGLTYLLKESVPMGISQVLQGIRFCTGVFVLKAMGDYIDIGLFQAPYRIFSGLIVIPMSFAVVLLPLFSKLASSDLFKKELELLAQRTLKLILIASLIITIIGFTFADKIVSILFGSEFSGSIIVFKILILGLSFSFLNIILISLFIATKKQRHLIFIEGIGLLISILLNLLLVYRNGYLGAGLAVVVSNITIFSMNFYFLYDLFKGSLMKTVYIPFAGIIPVLFIIYTLSPGVNKLLLLTCGMIFYMLILLTMNVFSKEELLYVKKNCQKFI